MRHSMWLGVMVVVAGCASSGQKKRSTQTMARPGGHVLARSVAEARGHGGDARSDGGIGTSSTHDASSLGGASGQVAKPAIQGSQVSANWYHCPARNAFMQPIVWDLKHADQRRYWTETDLTRVKTSKADPVEVCGVVEQFRWLMTAVCPDGTHPFKEARQAHGSRVGNVGPGGRCGRTVIDLYRVPCPGKTFMVYMDLYNCPRGKSPFSR